MRCATYQRRQRCGKDLGGAEKVTGKDGSDMYEVELPTARSDVDPSEQQAARL